MSYMQDGLHRRYDEYVLEHPETLKTSLERLQGQKFAELSKMVVEAWDDVTAKAIVRSAVACVVVRLCDFPTLG
jgi:hypothetical protein